MEESNIFMSKQKLTTISGIYAIKNIFDDKLYIGSSKDIKRRWTQHRSKLNTGKHDSAHLQRSWNKFGEEYFSFLILEEVEEEKLIDRENYWIDFYGSSDSTLGYNLRKEAQSNKGWNHSEESKKKISENNARLSGKDAPNYGVPRSDDVKKRISNTLKSKNLTGENSVNYGRKASEETKKKISESGTGLKRKAGTGEKISKANKGRISPMRGVSLSDERKEQIGEVRQGVKGKNKTSSKYVGVSSQDNGKYWSARINFKGTAIWIGSYNTEIGAALAYNAKAIELRGANAKINIIEDTQ